MSILGVSGSPEPMDNSTGTPSGAAEQRSKQSFSIFDENKDGKLTVQEQREAVLGVALEDETIKQAVAEGFDLKLVVDIIDQQSNDIRTDASLGIGKVIITPRQMVQYANAHVLTAINFVKEKATEYLKNMQNPNAELAQPENVDKSAELEE